MRNAILLHGMPSRAGYFSPDREAQSNSHWFPWLQHELLLRGVLAQTPELPAPYAPLYEDWRDVFERFEISKETILVGHSAGGQFLVRWLSESGQRVGRVALVAPALACSPETDFANYTIDPHFPERTAGVSVFVSADDKESIRASVARLRAEVSDLAVHEFERMGHFTLGDMGHAAFPELLAVLL